MFDETGVLAVTGPSSASPAPGLPPPLPGPHPSVHCSRCQPSRSLLKLTCNSRGIPEELSFVHRSASNCSYCSSASVRFSREFCCVVLPAVLLVKLLMACSSLRLPLLPRDVCAGAVLPVAAASTVARLSLAVLVLPAPEVDESAGGSTMLLISRSVTSLAVNCRFIHPWFKGQGTTWQRVPHNGKKQYRPGNGTAAVLPPLNTSCLVLTVLHPFVLPQAAVLLPDHARKHQQHMCQQQLLPGPWRFS